MRQQGFIQAGLEVKYLVAETIDEILPMLEAAVERSRVVADRRAAAAPT
jgi:hypothetical protein